MNRPGINIRSVKHQESDEHCVASSRSVQAMDLTHGRPQVVTSRDCKTLCGSGLTLLHRHNINFDTTVMSVPAWEHYEGVWFQALTSQSLTSSLTWEHYRGVWFQALASVPYLIPNMGALWRSMVSSTDISPLPQSQCGSITREYGFKH